ncbi:MAG: M20/M25/M40 family metallo-hydrolase, partial [Candidatus Aminicenantes bacterium]|nr:M20/M25/M40 family metallo-hydrolase [Candidatus Aminicenantes bacterium]
MKKTGILKTVESNLPAASELLKDLIRIPSTRGNEKNISRFLKSRIEEYADHSELVIIPNSIMEDPDYSFRLADFKYTGEANLRLQLRGKHQEKTIAFNTHLDVVPATVGQDKAFSPFVENNKIYGRGAIDCKGQIVTLWLMLKTLYDAGLKPGGDITLDFVIEEECGGNGSLAVVRNGLEADAAIILEPTSLHVVHLVRGAVWFEVETSGRAGHSGSPDSTVSALKEAIRAMDSIEEVREKLLRVSRKKVVKIADHPNPMPCTFGMLHSGNWPAAAPSEGVVKGV